MPTDVWFTNGVKGFDLLAEEAMSFGNGLNACRSSGLMMTRGPPDKAVNNMKMMIRYWRNWTVFFRGPRRVVEKNNSHNKIFRYSPRILTSQMSALVT